MNNSMQKTFGLGSRNPGHSFTFTVNMLSFYHSVFQIPPLSIAGVIAHFFNQQTLTEHILDV